MCFTYIYVIPGEFCCYWQVFLTHFDWSCFGHWTPAACRYGNRSYIEVKAGSYQRLFARAYSNLMENMTLASLLSMLSEFFNNWPLSICQWSDAHRASFYFFHFSRPFIYIAIIMPGNPICVKVVSYEKCFVSNGSIQYWLQHGLFVGTLHILLEPE